MENETESTKIQTPSTDTLPNFSKKNTKPLIISYSKQTELYKHISHEAITVLTTLNNAGYQAFLVGGGVRDVLSQHQPKDFDVVTDACPKEVRKLFSNSRLIGRRFVLAHVYFDKKIIEVSTFRAESNDNNEEERVTENGRILQDNVYSSRLDEDVWRRDFTINALYYSIQDFVVLDYTDGLADLQSKTLRLIGEPYLRYREDPVRLLRAARFAAKLGFSIESNTAKPLYELGHLLSSVPRSRLYDEVLKLFLTGHALHSLHELRKYDLFKHLFPQTEERFQEPISQTLVEQALKDTDVRIAENKPVTPAFLFAALLWPILSSLQPSYREKGLNEQDSLLIAARRVLNMQTKYISIPRRISLIMKDIWLLQLRLTHNKKHKRQQARIMAHRYFRAAYDFLMLRAQAGEPVKKCAVWWTKAQEEKKGQEF